MFDEIVSVIGRNKGEIVKLRDIWKICASAWLQIQMRENHKKCVRVGKYLYQNKTKLCQNVNKVFSAWHKNEKNEYNIPSEPGLLSK